MKVVSDLSDAALGSPGAWSIGNFDGLHLGHRRILEAVVATARRLNVQAAAMTFDPHPIQVLAPDKAPRLISTLLQKLRLLEEAGLDLVFVAPFDTAFAAQSPEDFIRRYIIDGFHARAICVGNNFTFGKAQAGTLATLRQWQTEFEIIEVPPVVVRGVIASSTRIRQLTLGGHVSRACRLLGRWLEIEGRIVPGAARGREQTVPTLNLAPDNDLIPARGVYVSRISVNGGSYMNAVTNVGTRPTFDNGEVSIETFVLNDTVPGSPATASLQFIKRLRDERRFDSPELLRQQIGRDVASARRIFRRIERRSRPRQIQVEVYSRTGCHLCDDAKAVIERFTSSYPIKLKVTDVDQSETLRQQYGNDIPVILINGAEAFRHRVSEPELERILKGLWNPSIS